MKRYKILGISAVVAVISIAAAMRLDRFSVDKDGAAYITRSGIIAAVIALIATIIFFVILIRTFRTHEVEYNYTVDDNRNPSTHALFIKNGGKYDASYDKHSLSRDAEKEKHKFD